MPYCINCGIKVSQLARFCQSCGTQTVGSFAPSETSADSPRNEIREPIVEVSSQNDDLREPSKESVPKCNHRDANRQKGISSHLAFCVNCNSFIDIATLEALPLQHHKFELCGQHQVASGFKGPNRNRFCRRCGVILAESYMSSRFGDRTIRRSREDEKELFIRIGKVVISKILLAGKSWLETPSSRVREAPIMDEMRQRVCPFCRSWTFGLGPCKMCGR